MKYLGLDIATATGWVYLEDDVLIDRGTIRLISGMSLPQKLHYFHLELKNLVTRLHPDYCFIEDVILGISGAKTLAFLARLNGVAINTTFTILQERVKLYEPCYWKCHSFEGLMGNAKKWQTQLAVIKHYNIPITGNFDNIKVQVNIDLQRIDDLKQYIKSSRVEINKCKAALNRKRNKLDVFNGLATRERIKELDISIKLEKENMKLSQKAFDKKMNNVKNDIAAQTGFTEDISDACGIAYCGYKEIQRGS